MSSDGPSFFGERSTVSLSRDVIWSWDRFSVVGSEKLGTLSSCFSTLSYKKKQYENIFNDSAKIRVLTVSIKENSIHIHN